MSEFTIIPKVDETQEFIEIANDFANPLDLVREAISNSFDARATEIRLSFEAETNAGETVFVIRLTDNGSGMGREALQSFFDLGNSTRRNDKTTIGEKGHGTKVYFNAKKVIVDTQREGTRLLATLDAPFAKLHERQIPQVAVKEEPSETQASGTTITIYGYNNNRRERFTHDRLRDHIYWFTKFGSVERQFGIADFSNVKLQLKGLDRDDFETLDFGHPFPAESAGVNQLFEQHTIQAPNHYCRRIIKTGSLPNHPEVRYNAIFSVEGKRVKYDSNVMLRRPGYAAPEGAYTVQDRYGLWLCKDFIPVQRKNEWITSKGSEFTKLHAFFNCQALKLTANRGSAENTPTEILQDVEQVVRKIYQDLMESDEWLQLSYLEEEADGYNTVEKEKKNFEMRVNKANKANIAKYKDITLVAPQRESGVHSLVVQLMTIEPTLFPFSVVDYDTLEGIDIIVKSRDTVPVHGSKLYYVEFKYLLSSGFNHSFENLHSIICWDTELKHGEIVKDINREERKLAVVAPEDTNDYTRYYLDNPRKAHRIEVFVLKDYLPQKLKIEFRPRTDKDLF
ncbi:ATP-binding protein [Prosthecobacter sp.]|uniref:ATP-binding protein n=1 Tax=Prosthecobacter sp. TaxID=1965333 RepID=UPI00378521D3